MQEEGKKANFIISHTTDRLKKEEIYRFRYEVYIEELQKNFKATNHQKKWLKDELDESAILFYVEVEGNIVATSRLNLGKITPFTQKWQEVYSLEKFSSYPKEVFSFSSRIMVHKEYRGSLALATMLLEIYLYVRKEGIKFDFCNCSPSLVEFYEHLGHRRYRDGFIDDDAGYQVPLVFMTHDDKHLRKVRSPFYRLAKKLENNSSQTTLWFEEQFLKEEKFINRRMISNQDFWSLLAEKISHIPSKHISLFKGLNEEEIQKFIGLSTIIKVNENEVILRPNDMGNEMFVLLEGVVEVKASLESKALSLAILEAGQIFGEMAFVSHAPRNAGVIAVTNAELLVLTQTFFNKAIKNSPAITARVLLNLGNILANRLRVCTQNWVEATNS